MSFELFAHAAALLLIAAMVVNNLRLVRGLALAAGLAAVVALVLAGERGLWLVWAGLFTLVAGGQLALSVARARANWVSSEERELVEHVLSLSDPKKQQRMKDLLTWHDLAPGDGLMKQGDARPPLVYIASGMAKIVHDGKQVGTCTAGDFLGEMSMFSGQGASATVEAVEPMRIAKFDRDSLALYAREFPEISKAVDGAINRSLAEKVIRMNEVVSTAGSQADGNG